MVIPLVSKSKLQIVILNSCILSSMFTEGILTQLQQRKRFHSALPSFDFSRFTGHHCSWMNISRVYFTLSTSNHTYYGCNICKFFVLMDGCYVILFSHLHVLFSVNLFLDCWIICHGCIVQQSCGRWHISVMDAAVGKRVWFDCWVQTA